MLQKIKQFNDSLNEAKIKVHYDSPYKVTAIDLPLDSIYKLKIMAQEVLGDPKGIPQILNMIICETENTEKATNTRPYGTVHFRASMHAMNRMQKFKVQKSAGRPSAQEWIVASIDYEFKNLGL